MGIPTGRRGESWVGLKEGVNLGVDLGGSDIGKGAVGVFEISIAALAAFEGIADLLEAFSIIGKVEVSLDGGELIGNAIESKTIEVT